VLKKDLISSLFWMTSAGLIIFGSLRLQLGVPQNPGPGFLPFLVGILLLILSAALLIRSLRERREEDPAKASGSAKRVKLFGTVAALLVFPFAFPHLGFLLTTIPLMIFLSRVVGELNWKISLTIGHATSFFMYFLFKVWLKVQFPTGPWGY
jgi:putative tricarboxylic transport membrane protein